MITTETHNQTDFAEWLVRAWRDGDVEACESWTHSETGEGFAQFGRRVLVDMGDGRVEYTRFDTVDEANREMEYLYDVRPPDTFDALICEDRGKYHVSIEGLSVGDADTRDSAERMLAQAMVDQGVFPDAFYVSARGDWFRIDEDIRAWHDDGGDKMRDDAYDDEDDEDDEGEL